MTSTTLIPAVSTPRATPSLPATGPPEQRGLARDEVRLLVARPGRLHHGRFRDLPQHLAPGDLVVVNTSATLPAAVDGLRADHTAVVVHVATVLDTPGEWVVELRRPDRRGPLLDGHANELIRLPGRLSLQLLAPVAHPRASLRRLWRARTSAALDATRYLQRHGRPIAYGYVDGTWPVAAYQTVFARHTGSAEMPSAGRPFTADLVVDLVAAGVTIAPITLHTGVSSPEAGEPPQAERFHVPQATADLVNLTRERGGRVVAVGTTVTRALETASHPDGTVAAAAGWTDLVLSSTAPARVVTGLVTGWHDDASSHIDLLEAVAGNDLVEAAAAAAHRHRYRWHEFGDSALFLPIPTSRVVEVAPAC